MTMLPVLLTVMAQEDVYDIASYLTDQSNDASIRFHDQFDRTLERLEEMPELGTVCRFENTADEIRVWPVKGFRNFLIFYRVRYPVATTILRVLHGSTNYETLFQ
jgi:plasmid stabilization system protein ParE